MKKASNPNLGSLFPFMVCLALAPSGSAMAQIFTNLYNFTATPLSTPYTNGDGASATATLVAAGTNLYGTTIKGGSLGHGTVFRVGTDGTGFTNLHNFSANEGDNYFTRLLLVGTNLYGTADSGGSSGKGTIFRVDINGNGFTNLHFFTATSGADTNSDGAYPEGDLILSGNTLYGTCYGGGAAGYGSIFAIHTDSTGFTNLHNFTQGTGDYPFVTNSDGIRPGAGLLLSSNTLYGTAALGGPSAEGTVFALSTNGTGFTTLHAFPGESGPDYTNSEGGNPAVTLLLAGNTLYGTAGYGGPSGNGSLFAINTATLAFTNLHQFTSTSNPDSTNSDGANPQAELLLVGTTLYSTTSRGGPSGTGTVYAINTNGSGFTTLHSFTAIPGSQPDINSDGAFPYTGLILSGNALFGGTDVGGPSGNGVLYRISLGPPPGPMLTIIPYGQSVLLVWPTNATGFHLQSATNLFPSAGWRGGFPEPIVLGEENIVVDATSGSRNFYRLSQ